MSHVARGRPPVARIAITAPPKAWFHGINHAFYEIYRRTLLDLGVEIFDVPVEALLLRDESRCALLLEELRAFGPELAFGLPLGSYALISRMSHGRDGFQPNLFADILDIPTICLWDHAPFELADQLLTPHPATPQQSTPGALHRLRQALAHPRLVHWSRDSGQVAIMDSLGLLPATRPLLEISPSLPGLWAAPADRATHDGVAFVGHLYQKPSEPRPPALAALATRAVRTWLKDGGGLWDVLGVEIAALPEATRRELALDRDQTFFWGFVHRLVVAEAQTARRLKLLGESGHAVLCYGNLDPALPGVPANLRPVPGHLPFGPELVAALVRHAITVDVHSAGFVNGFGHKPLIAFDAGGFMLLDRKSDFIAAFGEAGEAASYGSGEELAAKIDLFLCKPKLRREVGDAIRQRIAERHTLPDVLGRILEQAAALPRPASPPRPPSTSIIDLLPGFRRYTFCSRVRCRRGQQGVIVATAPGQWTYASRVAIPAIAGDLRQPHLRLAVSVESGGIDIGLLAADKGSLIATRFFGPRDKPVCIEFELPTEPDATVVFRNAVEGPSRFTVSELRLCDRRMPV